MGNGIGKMTAAAASTPEHYAAADPASAPPGQGSPLKELPHDLKALIASRLDPLANKALRLTDREFRQVGAQYVKKLAIPANETENLEARLRGLPEARSVAVTDINDAGLARLAAMDTATRSRIKHITAQNNGITDAGLVHLQKLTRLQSLKLHDCPDISDAGVAYLQVLPQLKSLQLSHSLREMTPAHLDALMKFQAWALMA